MNRFPSFSLNPNNPNKTQAVSALFSIFAIVLSGLVILQLGLIGMGLLSGILGTIFVTLIAYHFPLVTVAGTILTAQILGLELVKILPPYFYLFQAGPVLLRLFDPLLLGLMIAILLRLLKGDVALKQFLFKDFRTWSFFFGWIFVVIAISIGKYGFNTLGEFRTYYRYLLIIPYFIVSFRTRESQMKLFKLLIFFSLSMILIAFIRQGVLFGFSIAAYNKFLTSSGNMALLCALVGLMIAYKEKTLAISRMKYQLAIFTIFSITLLNSVRSVWLALAVVFLWFYFSGRLNLGQQFQLMIVFIIVLIIGNLAISTLGGTDFFLFLEKRLLAFTEFEKDGSSTWRYHLWMQALAKIEQHPIVGNGLGLHFNLTGLSGKTITTSPHNLYITLAYQLGVIGLIFYLAFWVQLVAHFRKALVKTTDKEAKTIIATSLTLLFAAAGYNIAYMFDLFTWLYAAVAMATVIRLKLESRQAAPQYSPGN